MSASEFHVWFISEPHRQKYTTDHPTYLAAREAWEEASNRVGGCKASKPPEGILHHALQEQLERERKLEHERDTIKS